MLGYPEHVLADPIPSPFFTNPNLLPRRKIALFPKPNFPWKRRERVRCVECAAIEQGLHPKPRPKPAPLLQDASGDGASGDARVSTPRSSFCEQIEKLVLLKRYREALELFEVLECDHDEYLVGSTTYESLIDACIALKSIRGAKRVYNHVLQTGFKLDQYLNNRILSMHVKCGMMVDARKVFAEMPERNMVSWNTILGGVVDSGDYEESFSLFLAMWYEFSDAGSRTFSTILRASAGLGFVGIGRQLHACAITMGIDTGIFVSCALIDMYSKCGFLCDAKLVFDQIQEKTVVAWNSIIAAYVLHGYSEEALNLYYQMQGLGVKLDHFTYSIVASICSRLASIEHAKQAHAGLIRQGFGCDIVANSALVDFYSKWGRVEDARHVFDRMPCKNIISWNALIAGYGNHGRGEEALKMFNQMIGEGMVPNHVTLLAVLSACSYSGLSDDGWNIFESMSRDYKVKPRAMHYACMIELLGREGFLDDALALIREAPFEPTKNMWAALLTACRIHKNVELGKFAVEKLLGMEPEKISNYMVLLNMHYSSGRTDEAVKVLETLKRRGLRLLPACSWIEIKKRSYQFLFGDNSHPQIADICEKLTELMKEIVKCGYISDKQKSLLPDVAESEERRVAFHSEKLAIAFGLMNTPPSTSLHIVQSHRICCDCHDVIKLITVVSKRQIVVRDASRFHHFKNGTCSCGDYW